MRGFRGIVDGAAAGVAVLVLSTGCAADEPAPSPPPSTTTTSSPSSATSSPTVAVPELPEAATVGDAAGAEAFVRHWVDVLNYAYQTGDTGPLDAITLPDCELCEGNAADIENVYRSGGLLEGGVVTVDLVRSPPPDADGTVIVSTRYAQADLIDVSEEGIRETLRGFPAENAGFVLDYVDGSWFVVGVGGE